MTWTVLTVQKISAGHTNDVIFPSNEDGNLPSFAQMAKIDLSAELFKRIGMKNYFCWLNN